MSFVENRERKVRVHLERLEKYSKYNAAAWKQRIDMSSLMLKELRKRVSIDTAIHNMLLTDLTLTSEEVEHCEKVEKYRVQREGEIKRERANEGKSVRKRQAEERLRKEEETEEILRRVNEWKAEEEESPGDAWMDGTDEEKLMKYRIHMMSRAKEMIGRVYERERREEEEERMKRREVMIRQVYEKSSCPRPLDLLDLLRDGRCETDAVCRVWREMKSKPKVKEVREVDGKWGEEVRKAYTKLEEERPLELEESPRKELERRRPLFYVPLTEQMLIQERDAASEKNKIVDKVVEEEEARREKKYFDKWREEVREAYLEANRAGSNPLTIRFEPCSMRWWDRFTAQTKKNLLSQVVKEERLKEKRAPYLLLEEEKREREESEIREAYLELERERPLHLQRFPGVERRRRLNVYRVSHHRSQMCDDGEQYIEYADHRMREAYIKRREEEHRHIQGYGGWKHYVGYRKTLTLRRITLEEETKRGRRREEWEEEEETDWRELECPHPFVYNNRLWCDESKCSHCHRSYNEVDQDMVWLEAYSSISRDDREWRRECKVMSCESNHEKMLIAEREREERFLGRKKGTYHYLPLTAEEQVTLAERKKALTEENKQVQRLIAKKARAEVARVKKATTVSKTEERKELARVRRVKRKEEGKEEKDREREEKKALTEERRQASLLAAKEARAEVTRLKKAATVARKIEARAETLRLKKGNC